MTGPISGTGVAGMAIGLISGANLNERLIGSFVLCAFLSSVYTITNFVDAI